MIEQKQNDWILNVLGNSGLSVADLSAAGLSADNTSLLDEDIYKQSTLITENPEFADEQGNFDPNKFHEFYDTALKTYNMLSNETYLERVKEATTMYGMDNIFAPKEGHRRTFDETVLHARVPNPDRATTGIIRIGEAADPVNSYEELAQTLKVLDNPTEVYDENGIPDWSKAVWHDAPNDSWFTDFLDTRVLAQWESDGEHEDPITGNTVEHKKGQLKLNENGTYFYENLDGRDIYGKLVLNKMNTLTTDGSAWNKYDFFDSDDLELKSIGGSVMKNLALVGSMFIPYVGPWIAGLSVATLLVGITGTLGKMLTGSESPTLSAMEGWSKSVNRQTAKTQYARENTWCWENFISLIGDVAGQLKEQRFLFEYAPALIKGNKVVGWNGVDSAKQTQFALDKAKEYDTMLNTKFGKLLEKGVTSETLGLSYLTAKKALKLVGQHALEEFMNSYNHIGSVLSKGYMTAITVGDTYGEAKYEGGASDLEASLLTLGYAAAEAALLNTGVGEWILPELKASGLKNKAMIKALTTVPEKFRLSSKNLVEMSSEAKKDAAKYWFVKGKELAEKLNTQGKGLVGQMVSGGLGEGIEEVTEELLADFSKSCYNAVLWLKGDDDKRMRAWDNMQDRYLMSFLGGAVGGGLTAAGTNFKHNLSVMTPEAAQLELIYMIRQGKKDEIYKSLNKVDLANPYLQFETEEDSEGKSWYKPASSNTSNMDLDVKKAFVEYVENMDAIIRQEGLKVTDNEFLDALTFKDIRLARLQESAVSGLYLQNFNNLIQEIYDKVNNVNAHSQTKSDSDHTIEEKNAGIIAQEKQELNDLLAKKDAYLNGDFAMDYISASLLDLNPAISSKFTTPFFKDYAENKYKKKFETLNDTEIENAQKEFDNWKNTDYKNHMATLAPLFLTMARNSGVFIQQYAENYDKIKENKGIQALVAYNLKTSADLMGHGIDPRTGEVLEVHLDEWLLNMQNMVQSNTFDTILHLLRWKGSTNLRQKLIDNAFLKDDIEKRPKENEALKIADFDEASKISEESTNLMYSELTNNLEKYYDDFIKTGAINPEIKLDLTTILKLQLLWLDEKRRPINILNIKDMADEYVSTKLNLGEPVSLTNDITFKDLYETVGDVAFNDYFQLPYEDLKILLDTTAAQLNLPPVETLQQIVDLQEQLKVVENKVNQYLNKVKNITYTDSIAFILNFILANSDSHLDMAKLLENVDAIITQNAGNLEGAVLDDSITNIEEALKVIDWLQGLVLAAQTDREASSFNLMSYNATLNNIAHERHVKDWEELPIITMEDSNIIVLDLQLTKNKLEQARNLYYINQGKKLGLLDRAAINKDFITYNRVQKLIVNVGGEWAEKDKLKTALDEATVLKQFAPTRNLKSLTEDLKKAIYKEMINIEHAVHEFFNNDTNKEKIIKGDLVDLFIKDFDLYSKADQYLDESTEVLEDDNFLAWLATRAAIDIVGFNNEFRQVIDPESETVLAPVSTLREAVFLNIAEILNGNMTTLFYKGYRKAIIDDFLNKSENAKKQILKRLKVDESAWDTFIREDQIKTWNGLPIYTNIQLTEGRPGAGKSAAVNYYTKAILEKFHSKYLKKTWLVHRTENSAIKANEHLKIKDASFFDKNKLMRLIYSKYNFNRTQNENGDYIYLDEEWVKDDEGMWVFKDKSDNITSDKIPSVIFIDEISHYDLADLMLIDDFARKYGITVLAAGDFSLSSITAESKSLTISPFRYQFKHSPRMGISMRTNNVQMDKTQAAYIAWDKNDTTRKLPLDTYFYENANIGLNGVKVVLPGKMQEIEDTIKLMISTLKTDAKGNLNKIGFFYRYDDSETAKLIDAKYSKYFEKFKGTSAQGLEGQYYVVDFEESQRINTDAAHDKANFYTGFTRASQGALVVGSPMMVTTHLETTTSNTSFSEAGLRNYAKKEKTLLDDLSETKDALVKETPRTTEVVVSTIPSLKTETEEAKAVIAPIITMSPTAKVPEAVTTGTTKVTTTWKHPNKLVDISYDGSTYVTDGVIVGKYIDASKSKFTFLENTDPVVDKVLKLYANNGENTELTLNNEFSEEAATNTHNNDGSSKQRPSLEFEVDNNVLAGFNYLLHSHNTFELGMKYDKDKDLLSYYDSDLERYEKRIDSALGLTKIYEADWKNPTKSASFYINKIARLRNALMNISDKNDLILAINDILNPSGEHIILSLDFGFLISPLPPKEKKWGYTTKNPHYGRLDKSREESTLYNPNSDPKALEPNRKTWSAVITLKDGKRLELPLFVLGNLETYTHDPKNVLSQRLASLHQKFPNAYEFHKAILEDDVLKNVPVFANLAKLFTFNNGSFLKVDDPLWTPAKSLRNWGILVNVKSDSGSVLPFNGSKSYTPISNFTNRSDMHFSSQIYTSLQPFVDDSGNLYEIANKGHAFIFVSNDDNIIEDDLMLKQYIRLLLDPNEPKKVTRVYVLPPKVSIDKYLRNMFALIRESDKEKRKNIKPLGSHMTSYYIWNSLLPELKKGNSIFNGLYKGAAERIIKELEEILKLSDEGKNVGAIINSVMGNSDWSGITGGPQIQSLAEHLNYQLITLFSNISDNKTINEDAIQDLAALIEASGLNHFYYSARFKNKEASSNQILVPLASDLDNYGNSLYTLDGLDFMINAKLDSNLFSADISLNDVILTLVDKIQPDTSGTRMISTDTEAYLNDALAVGSSHKIFDLKEDVEGKTSLDYFYDEATKHYIVEGKEIKADISLVEFFTRDELTTELQNISKGFKYTADNAIVKRAYTGYIKGLTDSSTPFVNKRTIISNILKEIATDVNNNMDMKVAFNVNGNLYVFDLTGYKDFLKLSKDSISENTDHSDAIIDKSANTTTLTFGTNVVTFTLDPSLTIKMVTTKTDPEPDKDFESYRNWTFGDFYTHAVETLGLGKEQSIEEPAPWMKKLPMMDIIKSSRTILRTNTIDALINIIENKDTQKELLQIVEMFEKHKKDDPCTI